MIGQFTTLGFKWEEEYTDSWKKNYNLEKNNRRGLVASMY